MACLHARDVKRSDPCAWLPAAAETCRLTWAALAAGLKLWLASWALAVAPSAPQNPARACQIRQKRATVAGLQAPVTHTVCRRHQQSRRQPKVHWSPGQPAAQEGTVTASSVTCSCDICGGQRTASRTLFRKSEMLSLLFRRNTRRPVFHQWPLTCTTPPKSGTVYG